MKTVTIHNDKIREVIYNAILAKLQSQAGIIDHTNTDKDGDYTGTNGENGARWWDKWPNPTTGKYLQTTGSMSVTDDGNITVNINLVYTLAERTDW